MSKKLPNNCFSLLDEDNEEEIITSNVINEVKNNSDPLSRYYNIQKSNTKKNEFNKNDPFKFNTSNRKKTISTQNISKEVLIKEIQENTIYESPGDYLKIYAKHLTDKEWNDISNYLNLVDIVKWVDIPKFYNALDKNILKVKQFHIFIMKNNIYPLWEDVENRKGSIIKLKVETIEETLRIMKILTVYFLNKNILKENNNMLNAISFNPKKGMNRGVEETYFIIQIWLKHDLSKYNYQAICNENINKLFSGLSIRVNKTCPEF